MNLKHTKILVRKDASIGWFHIYAEMVNTSADCEARCCHFGNVILQNQSTGVQIYVNWEHFTLSEESEVLC